LEDIRILLEFDVEEEVGEEDKVNVYISNQSYLIFPKDVKWKGEDMNFDNIDDHLYSSLKKFLKSYFLDEI
jgi:hypothetical protein